MVAGIHIIFLLIQAISKKLVEDNLKRKAKALKIEANSSNFSIEPYGITEKNEKLLFYKDIIIKGWTGYFILRGDASLIQLALNSGLGAKKMLKDLVWFFLLNTK